MFKKLAFISCAISVAFFFTTSALAKDDKNDMAMSVPKSIDNKVLDSLVGTWKGQSNIMGTPMEQTLKISWSVNHQFLKMELLGKNADKSKTPYEGIGMFGVDENGKVKTWWFDSWGAPAVSTGSGTIENNKLVINDGNAKFKEERSFQADGHEMTMHAKGSMNMDGKEVPFDQTVVYKR